MKHPANRRPWLALVAAAGLVLGACSSSSAEPIPKPATAEPIAGSDLKRVALTPLAAQRIDLQIDVVRTRPSAAGTVIPYSAVLYDPQGETWAFIQTGPLTYVRAPITVDRIDGDTALLFDGPPTGTVVVTVGAEELFGVEIGVGGE